jgi:hypothetical protein
MTLQRPGRVPPDRHSHVVEREVLSGKDCEEGEALQNNNLFDHTDLYKNITKTQQNW